MMTDLRNNALAPEFTYAREKLRGSVDFERCKRTALRYILPNITQRRVT